MGGRYLSSKRVDRHMSSPFSDFPPFGAVWLLKLIELDVRKALLRCLPDRSSGFVLEEIGFGREFKEHHPADVGLEHNPTRDTKLSAARKFGPSPDSYVKNCIYGDEETK